jgi:hypothetical protein
VKRLDMCAVLRDARLTTPGHRLDPRIVLKEPLLRAVDDVADQQLRLLPSRRVVLGDDRVEQMGPELANAHAGAHLDARRHHASLWERCPPAPRTSLSREKGETT